MSENSVCAVIVTYHPEPGMVQNMASVVAQSQQLVVVDNGSTEEELTLLRQAASKLDFHLIENGENLGIAEALNQGVLWAKQHGFLWVLLFDQDSKITDGFVAALLTAWEAHPCKEKVVSMHPRHVFHGTDREFQVKRAADGGPIVSITSGALMPVWIFDRIGLFASEYFIDDVDTEYCLRIRSAGYFLADARQAVLMHALGEPAQRTFLGRRFTHLPYSSLRRYYMTRNRIAVFRKYFHRFPRVLLWLMYIGLRQNVKIFMGEQDRFRFLRSIMLGTWDGLTGRMGKRSNL